MPTSEEQLVLKLLAKEWDHLIQFLVIIGCTRIIDT